MLNKLLIWCCLLIMLIGVPLPVAADPLAIDMNFADEDVRVVLHTLATVGKVNIVVDDSVKGNLTLKLTAVPFEQALEIITKSKGLSYRKIGETIIVESAESGAGEVIKLRYARASEIKKSLESVISGWKVKADADDLSNSLILNGSSSSIDKIKAIIASIDYPHKQVELEAKVVAVTKNGAKDLGIDWSWEATPQYPEVETESQAGSGADKTITRENNKGIIQFGHNPEGIPYEFYYQAKISALISKGDAKLLARPKMTAINGHEARILIGDRIPVIVEKSENDKTTTTVEYVDSGIKLTYTPSVGEDNTITAAVHTEVSTPSLVPEMKAYRITTREAQTNVRVKNGETIVIGGLIGSESSETRNKIPFLSDLPILGKLFSSVHSTKGESEIMIFLTAKVIE